MAPIFSMASLQLAIVLNFWALKLVSAFPDKRDNTSSCICYLDDLQPPSTFFGWVSREDASKFFYDRLQPEVTMTVITIIDTVRDTTTSTTSYPTGYTPSMTNAEGTQVQSIWAGSTRSLLAYPTVFINWPESYYWAGESPVPNATTCITAPSSDNAVWTTIPNPQPTAPLEPEDEFDWTYIDTATLADPFGSSYLPISGYSYGFWPLPDLGKLFPNESAMQDCRNIAFGPDWGGFLTPWARVVTTSYVGATAATAVA